MARVRVPLLVPSEVLTTGGDRLGTEDEEGRFGDELGVECFEEEGEPVTASTSLRA